jgi:3'-phosphoadenosine 5'-phosphosulfate sulfotransferase (PAPS reductase)/FAD synthetase
MQKIIEIFPVGQSVAPHNKYDISITPKVSEMLAANCVVSVGVSGGKDSSAVAIRLSHYLDSIGHTGPRVLIHADLGSVEWKDSLPVCEALSKKIGWELIVVQRKAGGMMERWEGRWAANLARYINLECVKLILPWSTPSMRFCTSELKTAVICADLSKRFKGKNILSVTGVRAAESSARAKAPIAAPQEKLMRRDAEGYNWNAILGWATNEVFEYHHEQDFPLHEAYTKYNSTRVSCAFCIMGSIGDLNASSSCPDNQFIYRRMVDLEIRSGYAFQGSRWLGDVAPHLLSEEVILALADSKLRAKQRELSESRIPKKLLYTNGWPTSMPTLEEATLLAEVRREVCVAIGVELTFITAESIIERYAELIAIKAVKDAKAKPCKEVA